MRPVARAATAVWLLSVVAAIVAARPPTAAELTSSYTYAKYLADFRKRAPATPAEYAQREALFAEELAAVLQHNADTTQLYRQGVNRFSDWTIEEKSRVLMAPGRDAFLRSQRREGGRLSADQLAAVKSAAADGSATKPIRPSVDYRRSDPPVLTAVKDQGYCGACWSFATAETVEAHAAIKTGKLFSLSMQQMISCVPNVTLVIANLPPDNRTETKIMEGCDGYWPTFAIDYVVGHQGGAMTQEWEIPFQSYFAQINASAPQYKPVPACMNSADRIGDDVNVTGYTMLPRNDPVETENTIFTQGPLIAVIDVPQSLMAYEAGIYAGAECMNNDFMSPAHAVQIVGYGHDASAQADYWIVRNSWAPSWGESGYVRMLKTTPAMCGEMWLPTGGNELYLTQQKACGMCGLLAYTLYPIVE